MFNKSHSGVDITSVQASNFLKTNISRCSKAVCNFENVHFEWRLVQSKSGNGLGKADSNVTGLGMLLSSN